MKQTVYFPVYNIYSDLVKTAIGLKDSRSIEKFFIEAGVKIHDIGGKRVVMCQDLLGLTSNTKVFLNYEAKSSFSREIDDLG